MFEGIAVTQAQPNRSNFQYRSTTKARLAAGVVLALLAFTAPVLACRGAQYHRTILLDAIPPAAEESDVIARVEILEVRTRELPGLQPFPSALARVLQSVRGTADGQILEIYAMPSSCGGGLDQDAVGRKGFIAGRFGKIVDKNYFMGSWSYSQIGKL